MDIMEQDKLLPEIKKRLLKFDRKGMKTTVSNAITAGVTPSQVIEELREGLEEIGKKYESGEYFLSELIMSGETAKTALEVLKPHFNKIYQKMGKVVIGTIEGDLHDIGKNIVSTILQSSGFEVYDLGVDVKSTDFINKVREVEAEFVAISALLTGTMMNMKKVVDELKENNLREKVKVIVGGQPLTEEFAQRIGADAYVDEAPKVIGTINSLKN